MTRGAVKAAFVAAADGSGSTGPQLVPSHHRRRDGLSGSGYQPAGGVLSFMKTSWIVVLKLSNR